MPRERLAVFVGWGGVGTLFLVSVGVGRGISLAFLRNDPLFFQEFERFGTG